MPSGPLTTDPIPKKGSEAWREYRKSHFLIRLKLPLVGKVRPLATALTSAVELGAPEIVEARTLALLKSLSSLHNIETPSFQILGRRPNIRYRGGCTSELFGDYTLRTCKIRIWLLTPQQGKPTSPKRFLNTLIHEFCHHVDRKKLELPFTFHTVGFYSRINTYYHHLLGTPLRERRRLVWNSYFDSQGRRYFQLNWAASQSSNGSRQPRRRLKARQRAERTMTTRLRKRALY